MRICMLAPDLCPCSEQGLVLLLHDIARFQRPGEAWPASAGVILILGAEQGFSGDDINIDPFMFVVPVGIIKGLVPYLFSGLP